MAYTRKPNEVAQQTMPLVLLCAALIATNSYLTFLDDEVRNLEAATQSARSLLAQSFSGGGQSGIPAFYSLLLHLWLRLTDWNFEYLRVPAIVFFLVGLFLLGRAARRFGGPTSASTIIWLSVLWPFGFHYGRLEAPYSFVFFLIAGITLTYLNLLDEKNPGTGIALFLFGAALLWTSFMGWAVLACLAVDQLLRHFAGERTIPKRVMIRTLALWIVAAIPIMRPSYREFIATANFHQGFKAIAANFAVHLYALFVSESVAPWRWQLSIPAAIAVLICIVLVCMKERGPSRRFLMYAIVLLLGMAATGTLLSSRLFFVAPWILLPIAVAIGSIKSKWARPALAVALLIIGAIGWSGIYSRRYYSAPQFLETWSKEAGDAADKIRNGATVISNSRPFFLYLTYALHTPINGTGLASVSTVSGLLPDSMQQTNVRSADQWIASGAPLVPVMIWVHGHAEQQPDAQTEGSMQEAARRLDNGCGSRVSRLMMRDTGYDWKTRHLPQTVGPQWRIEVHEYDCASSNSNEVFPIPAH